MFNNSFRVRRLWHLLFAGGIMQCVAAICFAQVRASSTAPSLTEVVDPNQLMVALLSDGRGLVLSSDATSISDKFYFNGMITRTVGDHVIISKLMVVRSGDRLALEFGDGAVEPLAVRTSGNLVAVDPSNPGGLVFYSPDSFSFAFQGPTSTSQLPINLGYGDLPDTQKSQIIFDPKSILQPALAHGTLSLTAHNEVSIRTPHLLIKCCLAAAEAKYPLSSLSITVSTGTTIAFWNFHLEEDPPLRMFDVSQAQLDKSGIRYRTIKKNELAELPQKISEMDAASASKSSTVLQSLFPPDPRAQLELRASDLVIGLREIDEWGVATPSEDADILSRLLAAKRICLGSCLRADANHPVTELSSRSTIYNRACEEFGKSRVNEIVELFRRIAMNSQRTEPSRLVALDAVGDIGAENPVALLASIAQSSQATPLSSNMEACLATIRVRFDQALPTDASDITKSLLDETVLMPLRARCLQSLCRLDHLPDQTKAILDVASSTKANDWSLPDDHLTMATLGTCAAGRQILLNDFESQSPILDQQSVFDILWSTLRIPQADYARFVQACGRKLDDPSTDVVCRARMMALVNYGPPPADGLARRMLAAAFHADGPVATKLYIIIAVRHWSLDYLNELQNRFLSSQDAHERQTVISVSVLGLPVGGVNGNAVTKLLHMGLADSDAAVRTTALKQVGLLAVSNAVDISEFKTEIGEIIRSANTEQELVYALFDLKTMSGGKFDLEGAPVKDSGWPSESQDADEWWAKHEETVRQSAIEYLKG